MKKIFLKTVAGIPAVPLIVIPFLSLIAVLIFVESKLIHAVVFLLICLYFRYMYKFSTKKENRYTDSYIIARRNFSGNLVFFEMLKDGTCGYYYKWYENCRGFRSDFYELMTKAPKDIQKEIIKLPSYPQSQKVTEFVKILVTEYLEKNK